MGHLSTSRNHIRLMKRLDQFVPGTPDSKYLYEILKLIFTEEEAILCSVMPLNYFTLTEISQKWGKSKAQSEEILQSLADKGLVYDFESGHSHL